MSLSSTEIRTCPTEDVAAYLDRELSLAATEDFEAHLPGCAECGAELLAQKQLLCTLDAAFNGSRRIKLPPDFTRVVAAHAESNLRGVRNKTERRRSLQLCAMLALAAFALLGTASGVLVFQPIRSFVQIIARVSDLMWQTVYDAALGAGIIMRMIGRGALENPYGVGLLAALAFLVAVSLLPRLIVNYHRTQIIE